MNNGEYEWRHGKRYYARYYATLYIDKDRAYIKFLGKKVLQLTGSYTLPGSCISVWWSRIRADALALQGGPARVLDDPGSQIDGNAPAFIKIPA